MGIRQLTTLALTAGLLTACASVSASPPPPPASAEADPARLAEAIEAFAQEDRIALRPPCPIVFTGSSSIRFWRTLGEDMAPLPVINRGFGGSHISDVNHHFQAVAGRHRPRSIVFYAGENDLNAGKTADRIVADFERFLTLKSQALGDTPVYFISLKPSKARWAQYGAQQAINGRIKAIADRRSDLEFIDVAPAMLADGRPRDIFVDDDLHMTPQGYVIWTSVIRPVMTSRAAADGEACARRR